MRRGIRIPAWYLLLVAVLGILSGCKSLRDLERFAIRHHAVLTESLGIELRRPPSDSSFRYFFHQVDVAALCAAIRDWTIAQIPGGAEDLDQLVCDGKTLRGSIEPTAGGGSAFIAQVTLYSTALGVERICLDQHALEIQLAKQLFEYGPLMVLSGGVAGLTDGHTQGGGVQRDLSNECRAAAGRRLDRAS